MEKYIIGIICLLTLGGCNSATYSHKDYYENGFLKTDKTYHSQDSSSYDFISYYPNGHKQMQGKYINSLKEGSWCEWYDDGMSKGTIQYVQGDPDFRNPVRKLPTIVCSSDSLKVGVATYIRTINSYPNDVFSSNNGVILSLGDCSKFNFEIIPAKIGTVNLCFYCPWIISHADTSYVGNEIHIKRQPSAILLRTLTVY